MLSVRSFLALGLLLLLLLPQSHAKAQFYERHWNTAVIAAPVAAKSIVTGAIPRLDLKPADRPGSARHSMDGLASFYWQPQMTASGERFDRSAMTAAHRTLPMNTKVRVTHIESGKSVVVRINDRGPFKAGRVIDLSDKAAEILGFKKYGLARVKLDVVQ